MNQMLIRLAIVLTVAATTAVTTFVATWFFYFYYRPTLEFTNWNGPIHVPRVYLFPLGWVIVALLALAWLGVAYWIVIPAIRSR